MGLTNIGLWKSLDVSVACTFFKHPNTNNNIYVFADVPHLLKLARNHFIDNGFVLKDEKYIGKSIVEEYLQHNKQDLGYAYKISERHLNVTGFQRQNVRLAAQLFSNSLANAIMYCGQKEIIRKNNWNEAASTIQLFNDWFDVMNTQLPKDKFVSSYGLELEKQNHILNQMNEFITLYIHYTYILQHCIHGAPCRRRDAPLTRALACAKIDQFSFAARCAIKWNRV